MLPPTLRRDPEHPRTGRRLGFIRFARLMAVTMAALFTGALAGPAYATGGGCDSHSATAPSATAAARRRARSSTISTRTAGATPVSPASPASASGPTTTTTASSTPASPTTTPTRAAGYSITRHQPAVDVRRDAHLQHHPRPTACARSSRAGAAPATGRAPTRTPRPPAASPPATAAASAAATARSTRRPRPRPRARTSATTAR